MLNQRIVIGVVGFLFIVLILTMGNLPLAVVLSFVAMIALYEMYDALGIVKNNPALAIIGFGFCLAVFSMNIHGVVWGDFTTLAVAGRIVPAMCMYIIVLIVYMVLTFDNNSFNKIATSFFAATYITVLFAHILLIRQSANGEALVWLVFISPWATDTFAFTAGLTLGKRKLIPKVSPKKTVEGAIGGVLGCVIIILIYGAICKGLGYNVKFSNLIILAVLSSLVSQFGDLAASCIKREHNVKDYGSLLPGHGGVLDRFDSVLPVAPFIYYFCMILPVIV